ncbi:MAG: response regulator [Acidimicrobiia bacterium]|nr:response regulator [Acidimicrobiia bacterium]
MKARVLVVDDSLTVRMDLAEAFEAAGFDVVACATLAEARAALEAGVPDVLVTDHVLPDGYGTDLVRAVRSGEFEGLPAILMLSTEAEVGDRIHGLQSGADEYVGKPYDTGYLVARTRELLRLVDGADRSAGTPTVLVIDGGGNGSRRFEGALESAGYDVRVAATGEDGLRLAAVMRPEAIVVDSTLPGLDGEAVIRRVKLDVALRNTPCLLLTAPDGAEVSAELRALDAGADGVVVRNEEPAAMLARLDAARRGRMAHAGAQTRSLAGPRRVLVVEAEPAAAERVAAALRPDGYDVVLARSGEDAAGLLAVQAIDCILLGHDPSAGALETCSRIKAAPAVRDIPLVALAADTAAAIESLSAGADDAFGRDGDGDALRARVRAQIRRRQMEDEQRRVREALLQSHLEAANARAARELAEARAVLVEELERKNRELESFSYSVSHDLRAPLRSIDGFSQALQEDCEPLLDRASREHLRRVRMAARRMGELIDDLLHLSRVGRAGMHRAPVSLSDVAMAVVADLRRQHPDREVTADIEPGLAADADVRLVRVLLENLLGNAWKFTGEVDAPRVGFRSEGDPCEPVFVVHDNGAGFDMRYAAKLFQPFQRLHDDTRFPGTGIGLATVYRIVERHGGRVWAEGAPGRGATFHFTLPASRAADRLGVAHAV